MSTFYAQYPASAAGSNASVGPNGQPAPTSSTEIGGINPGGDLTPVSVDNAGNVNVNVVSSALPTGAATAANQVLEINELTGIHSDTTAINGKTVHVDTDNVTVTASALPTGAATAANQATEIASLASIDSKLTSPLAVTGPLTDTQLRASPVPVDGSGSVQPVSGTVTVVQPTGSNLHTVIDSGSVTVTQATGSNLHAVIDSSALPTGAATAANQATEIASLASIDSKLTSPLAVAGPLTDTELRASAVPVSLASTTVTGNVTVVQPTGSNLHTVIDSSALPAGAATAANQATEIASLASIDTKLTAPLSVNQQGRSIANAPVRNDYTSVNVTTAAYVQLVASTTTATKEIEIFDSSGQTLFLAIGAAASEVNQIIIFPGGNGRIPLAIAAGTRISIKAISATANTGEIDINFYQ